MIKSQGLWPLKDLYKSTPAEKRQEMWDALPEEKRVAPKKDWEDSPSNTETDSGSAEPISDSAVDAATDEDLFADDSSSNNSESTDSTELF